MLLEWRLKQIRLRLQKKLNSTNLALYKSMTLYIQNSGLRVIEKEEILQQIIDMILQAQAENKPMSLIIGNDYEEFCRSVIEEYGRGKSRIYKAFSFIQRYLVWMLLISAAIIIFSGIFSFSLPSGITIDQLLLVNIISLVILPLSKRSRQQTSSFTSLYSRFYIMKRGFDGTETQIFAAMLVMVLLIRFIIARIFGSEAFNYTVALYKCMPYALVSVLIIGTIEIYKRIYDKRLEVL